jgi:hypothetical protein
MHSKYFQLTLDSGGIAAGYIGLLALFVDNASGLQSSHDELQQSSLVVVLCWYVLIHHIGASCHALVG